MLACGNVSSFLLEYLFASCRCLARSSVTLKALDGFVLCFSSRGSFLLLLGCFLLLPFRLRDLLDALKSLHFIELTSDHFDFNKIRPKGSLISKEKPPCDMMYLTLFSKDNCIKIVRFYFSKDSNLN